MDTPSSSLVLVSLASPRSSCASFSRVLRVGLATRMRSRDKRSGVTRSLTAALAFALVAVLSGTARAAGPIDPALGFRVLPTEHFVIYFHQGEDASARRLATIAEET